jgi:hypothetical protein
MDNVWYLIFFAAVMLVGVLVMMYNERKAGSNQITENTEN